MKGGSEKISWVGLREARISGSWGIPGMGLRNRDGGWGRRERGSGKMVRSQGPVSGDMASKEP